VAISGTSDAERRVCFVTTAAFTLKWYLGPHIRTQSELYDLTLVADGRREELGVFISEGVKFIPLPIKREISIFWDLYSLFRLWRIFRKHRYDCVHSIMQKSGLLAMVAAKLAGVPLRCHTFTGQVWLTKSGFFREFLKFMDRLIVASATQVFADSCSQRSFLVEEGIVDFARIAVLADGSITGVDLERFARNETARSRIRIENHIAESDIVFIFVGRLARDKGLFDLSKAFKEVATSMRTVHLMIVGPDEGGFDSEFESLSQQLPGQVHRLGFTDRPEDYMSSADVLCLPSYREGFGSVIIEAAAVGIPAVASRIFGITDAIEEGVTGLLHEAGSVSEMVFSLKVMANDSKLRHAMGAAAHERAITKFPQERLTGALLGFYQEKFEGCKG